MVFVFLSIFSTYGVSEAAEYQEVSPAESSSVEFLGDLDDSDSIVVLNNGAVIQGGIFEISDSESLFSETIIVDTDSHPLSITVGEFKEKQIENEAVPALNVTSSSPLLRGPNPSNTIYTVPDGGTYRSQNFSGSGWRFAGYLFKPSAGTGAYLRWQTFNDSALIGSSQNAKSTKNTGYAHGNPLYPGSVKYFTGAGNITTYYTFNPVAGSFYRVSNY